MARRATVVKQERDQGKAVVLLDAGDTFFGPGSGPQNDSTALVEAMNRLGYDAMTLGDLDFAQGLSKLRALAQKAKFPLLAANLQIAGGPGPFWKPYILRQFGGPKVAVIGLVGQSLASQIDPKLLEGQRLTVSDPVETARELVRKLQPETTAIIVLSHLGIDGDRRLAAEVPGIAAIVGGHSRALLEHPEQVGAGGTLVAQAGYFGEFVGILRLRFGEEGQLEAQEGLVVTLTPDVADDPDLKALMEGR